MNLPIDPFRLEIDFIDGFGGRVVNSGNLGRLGDIHPLLIDQFD